MYAAGKPGTNATICRLRAAVNHGSEGALGARRFARLDHPFSLQVAVTDGPRTVTRRGRFFEVTGGNGPSVRAQCRTGAPNPTRISVANVQFCRRCGMSRRRVSARAAPSPNRAIIAACLSSLSMRKPPPRYSSIGSPRRSATCTPVSDDAGRLCVVRNGPYS